MNNLETDTKTDRQTDKERERERQKERVHLKKRLNYILLINLGPI